jgi:hypothetical protein
MEYGFAASNGSSVTFASGREVPVVDLEVLRETGVLGPSARALVRRIAERMGAESIP